MNSKKTQFNSFCYDFRQDVIGCSEEDGTTHEDKFTELIMDALEEADETENAVVCYHKKTGLKINGYGVNDSGDVLDLFISDYYGQVSAVNIPKSGIILAFKHAEKFFQECLNGYYRSLEEAQPVYDLSDRIYRFSNEFRKIRFFLLTDRISRLEEIKDKEQGDFVYTYQVWDISRFHKLVSSGKNRESITINITDDFDNALPCLDDGGKNSVYTSYLALIPGKTLVDLYDEYGPRLLERNVRSFLQVRGNVNKGIRDTILNDPEMFLAYNNGLSTTAEEVKTEVIEGITYITHIRDFQIVNGAQTTATIHDTYMKNRDRVNLAPIYVPMKLTVLKDLNKLNEIVPRISQYSNTQNKIDMADFSSNHPFHMKMEELSGRIRAPSREGIQLESYWFYERVRGQYLNKKNRETSFAKKKLFDKIYPKSQRIEKTDLPIFEHTWQMRPWEVSLGKQKNYKMFMDRLTSGSPIEPDEKYFMDAVAKAILYRGTYSIVRKDLAGGYRPNIVTYAIAYLNFKTGNKISLEKIWKEQDICSELKGVLSELVKEIQQFIITAPEGRNVTEFCKKKECWDKLCQKNIELAEEVKAAFSFSEKTGVSDYSIKTMKESGKPINVSFSSVSPEDWKTIQNWGLETGYLDSKQRNIANKIFSNMKAGRYCSSDLMLDGLTVIHKAKVAGFNFSSDNITGKFDPEKSIKSGGEPAKVNPDTTLVASVESSGISDEMIDEEIVKILKKHGGKCKVFVLFRELKEKWASHMTEYDRESYDLGLPRWRVRVAGMKNHFIENKILMKHSNIEIWVMNPDYGTEKNTGQEEINSKPKLIKDIHGKILNSGLSDEKIEEGVIHVLKKQSGAAQLSVLLSELEDVWGEFLTPVDLEKGQAGYVRWRARVSSKKNTFINKGILDKNRQSGIWKLDKSIYNDSVKAATGILSEDSVHAYE
jgi:hypothetical protein